MKPAACVSQQAFITMIAIVVRWLDSSFAFFNGIARWRKCNCATKKASYIDPEYGNDLMKFSIKSKSGSC